MTMILYVQILIHKYTYAYVIVYFNITDLWKVILLYSVTIDIIGYSYLWICALLWYSYNRIIAYS